MQLTFELNCERGSTLVMVTHDLKIAARCDRVATMAAGRLVQDGGRESRSDLIRVA